MLSLDVRVYCLVKKLLNRFDSYKTSITSLLSSSSGSINRHLLIFTCFQTCFGGCFCVITFIGKAFKVSQFGRIYLIKAFDISVVRAFKDV